MLYRTVMVLGVLTMIWSAAWFYRIATGLEHLHRPAIIPMVGGGIAGGLAAFYFVPWLMKREARRRDVRRRRHLGQNRSRITPAKGGRDSFGL